MTTQATGLKIMVIDDSSTIRRSAEIFLTQAGYQVVLAEDGFDALAKINDHQPALVFCDILMPRLDGYQTCALIKKSAKFHATPVVMLSSKDGLFDRARGAMVGSIAYLTKPFSFDELLARVRALLRRKTDQQSSLIRFADLEMDLVKRKVKRGARDLALTSKEFSLLEYFMRNPNKPLSRTSIAEHVWDVHFDSDSNVIDVYVNMLRKKISQKEEKRLIHTIVGVGYVLREE